MPLEYRFICPLPHGVHARPASALEAVTRDFVSEVILLNERTQYPANGKSILDILSADIRLNDPCVIKITGADESEALSAVSSFLRDRFPHCDDALLAEVKAAAESQLPPSLPAAGITIRRGEPVVPGIGWGRVVRAGQFNIPPSLPTDGVTDAGAEQQKVETALQRLVAWYDQRMAAAENGVEGELLGAHRAMARDQALRQFVFDAIAQRRRTAAGAIADAEASFSAKLVASENALLRERVLDVQDVCVHLLHLIYGQTAVMPDAVLKEDSIVMAETLAPGRFLALDRLFLKGLVLAQAGATSHTVILARSFGIPTLAGTGNLAGAQLDGQEAVVDAESGILATDLTEAARRYYRLEQQRLAERCARLRQSAAQPAATRDGHRIEITANLVTADEAPSAFTAGAEGVGLFRTEMLFLGRDSAPGEAEQFQAYRSVLEAAGGRPVVIRTVDIGGDKPLSYLNLPGEDNPFLGCRGVRLYPGHESLLRTQVRALVRASAHGRLKLMIPMVTTVDEARWVKKIVAEEQARCSAESVAFDAAMPVGAMIEVPAAAFALDALGRELDFFSVGSNDLLQYFMAADRANARVAGLNNPLQPAFLRFLKQIVQGVHARQKTVSLCGELGGQARFLPLLAGLGFDQISVAPPAIGVLKAELAGLTAPECGQLLEAALDCATADDVAALLEQFAARHGAALLDEELVVLDAEALTKEEAIKLAVDRLYVLGRTEQPHAVEVAVGNREATYSTGFGHGFAIPHCKTNAVKSSSLVLVKLRSPVTWNSLDGQPVRVVILLALRESGGADEHMKVLAKLARRLMHEEFRDRLEKETDPKTLCALLRETIQPAA